LVSIFSPGLKVKCFRSTSATANLIPNLHKDGWLIPGKQDASFSQSNDLEMLRFEFVENDRVRIKFSWKDSFLNALRKQPVVGGPDDYLSILVLYAAPNVASVFVLFRGVGKQPIP